MYYSTTSFEANKIELNSLKWHHTTRSVKSTFLISSRTFLSAYPVWNLKARSLFLLNRCRSPRTSFISYQCKDVQYYALASLDPITCNNIFSMDGNGSDIFNFSNLHFQCSSRCPTVFRHFSSLVFKDFTVKQDLREHWFIKEKVKINTLDNLGMLVLQK